MIGNCWSSAFPSGLLTPAEIEAVAPLHVIEGSTVRYGWSDFDGWAAALERSGISLNVVGQIVHSTLRQAVKATEARPANDEDLAVMKRLVAEAVEQGAVATHHPAHRSARGGGAGKRVRGARCRSTSVSWCLLRDAFATPQWRSLQSRGRSDRDQ